MSELKPCPFCGKAPSTYWDYISPEHECYNGGFTIECVPCGIEIWRTYKEKAIKAWNHRAEQEEPHE